MTDRLAAGTLQRVREAGVLAVVRAPSAEAAVAAGDALVRGGITGIEVTFSTPGALEAIAELRHRHPGAVVGAGTVTTAAQAEASATAGAAFLVSPGTLPELARAMLATGLTTMTGAMTPSEVMQAMALGVDVVKVFPASLGGPALVKALREPFADAVLMPTGGVTAENLADFLAAGAIAVGAGGDLLPRAALEAGDWDAIETRAARYADALRAARSA
ncbi:bifunctional 4-hydroxy-2-oxoglutarate aldolase/2-dehydro-3-deoxy-phosphogluconate aldolase [Agrococcus sp. TF02-05]|uniref:bifunctional 4-hydroxy-2-oxoglutarate aldolase/2-dehydro-3-deoxy-phosphogluconate aldolase n=1 Tax=Agrococcus sp. TF02-05 TaxID=2815211 RepID=UPI0027DDA482|nr:bifunctional 4-hydroxy-2-oxoglutarate aldolase/2-dehydro-3-deoxy-phosphogluconate aldolase [Agrococcus sp. TF02-05]